MDANFLSSLAKILPPENILRADDECRHYGTDWTKLPGTAGVVVRPGTTAEVAQILRLCSDLNVPVVPSGGRTGLAGGAVANPTELVLSLSRMNRLSPVDELGRNVRVQAGATTQSVHEHCEKVGLTWPIDLAAKGSSQIGGNLSTNAGGVRVIRYGMARKWVTALQIVTPGGEVIELNHELEKNNTGYDLIQLIVGSEGTLAVITEASLKLARVPARRTVFLFSLPDIHAAQSLFQSARRAPFEILAFEFFSELCLETVERRLGKRSRLSHRGRFYALLEVEGEEPSGWLEKVFTECTISDGLLADTSDSKKEVWALREGITESIALTGPVKKYDISVPIPRTASFLTRVEAMAKPYESVFLLYLFGHLGDGSPHLNLVQSPSVSTPEFETGCKKFEAELFPLLKEFHGSISSEHGVGLLKKHWVTYSRTKEEMRIFKGIKKVFDPKGLLNPHKVIDL